MNPIDDGRRGVASRPTSVSNSWPATAPGPTTRRQFLATATRAVAATSLAALDISRFAHAAGSGVIRLGLIGCGWRGTGATRNALEAGKDIRVVAMADLLEEKITSCLDQLRKVPAAAQLDVTSGRRFSGFDGFQSLLAAGVDGVMIATPPGFHPLQFEAAVRAGVHCFLEKPVAVDAPGVRSIRTAAAEARRKRLSVIVGFQEHFEKAYEQFMSQIANGALGKISKLNAIIRMENWPRGILQRPALDRQLRRPATEMDYQIRNWYQFLWLSGDPFVETLVHPIDTCVWAMGGPPQSARGQAERREHTGTDFGNISDFLSAHYLYPAGTEIKAEISVLAGNGKAWGSSFEGEKGIATPPDNIVDRQGQVIWRFSGPKNDPHREEIKQWCDSIRQGKGLNTVDSAADSTLVAIMGRTAAYTGREVTWTEMLSANDSFFIHNPKSFQDDPPELPDKFGDYLFPPRGRQG